MITIKQNQATQDSIRDYIETNEITEKITGVQLNFLYLKLLNEGLLEITEPSWRHNFRSAVFDLLNHYGVEDADYGSWFNKLNWMVLKILRKNHDICVLEVDTEEESDSLVLTNFLYEEYPMPMTFRGKFILNTALSRKQRKACTNVIIDGTLITYTHINLPPKLYASKVVAIDSYNTWQRTEYNSVAEYMSRPEKEAERRERREAKIAKQKCEKTGILSHVDNLGIPLEVGCKVCYAWGGLQIGSIVGQTPKKVLVSYGGRWPLHVPPKDILRLK